MRKYIRRIVYLATIAVIAMAGLQQGPFIDPAEAKKAYTVKPGVVFSNPYGSKAQRRAILDQIHGAIDNAPKGSVIRIVTYSIKFDTSADKLIKAHKRGVKVQIITSDHLFNQEDTDKETAATKELRRLMKALGTKAVADNSRSFVKVCTHGCASEKAFSSVHSKIYTFSTAGKSKRVVMIGSSNLSLGHSYAWNDMYKVVGNSKLYNALIDNFYKMVREEKNVDLYQNIEVAPNLRLYTFPRDTDSLRDDVHYTMLEKVRCTGAASGYGVNGKTAVDIAMFKWTDNRGKVAEKLRELANSGCRVRVLTEKNEIGKNILKILTAPNGKKASTIVLKDGGAVVKKQEIYNHHKFLTINGYYVDPALSDKDNRSSKIVFMGSPNLTSSGLRHNNEVMLRIRDAGVHKSYTSQFTRIWDKYSKAYRWVDPN